MTGQYLPGTLTLYNGAGVRLTFLRYTNPTQRGRILARWKQDYGDKFKTFYYHITPDVREGVVTKMKPHALRQLPQKLKIPA